jgi:LPS export ABC transporter protein LptC
MKKIRRIRLIVLGIALVIIAAVLAVALLGQKKPIIIAKGKEDNATSTANVALTEVAYSTTNKDNFKEWDLNAQSAQYFQGEKRVILEDVIVNLYRPDGKTYHIKGTRGEFNTESRNISMQGNITASMPDNTTIHTNSFFYDNEKRVITTRDKIIIQRGNFALEGVGMVVDLNSEKLSILGHVKALGSK